LLERGFRYVAAVVTPPVEYFQRMYRQVSDDAIRNSA
jgi:hypothetical protein